MKNKMYRINALAPTQQVVTRQQELDCAAARIWCANNQGKWMFVGIGKGRFLAHVDDGRSLTVMLTTQEASFPPCDAVMVNGDSLLSIRS